MPDSMHAMPIIIAAWNSGTGTIPMVAADRGTATENAVSRTSELVNA